MSTDQTLHLQDERDLIFDYDTRRGLRRFCFVSTMLLLVYNVIVCCWYGAVDGKLIHLAGWLAGWTTGMEIACKVVTATAMCVSRYFTVFGFPSCSRYYAHFHGLLFVFVVIVTVS